MIRSKVDTWRVQETASPIIGMGDLKISHQPWRLQAACAEVGTGDMWFPRKGGDEYTQAAKAVCRQCPVIMDCLQYALDTDQRHGVWGGMSAHELAKLRRQRAGTEYKYAHICEQCGTPFRSHSKRSRFCGKQCIYRAAQERKKMDAA